MVILKSFLNNIPFPLWIEELNNTVLFFNQAYSDMFNVNFNVINILKGYHIFPKNVAKIYNSNRIHCIETLSKSIFEATINDQILQFHIFPLLGEKDEIIAIGSILLDLTSQRKYDVELESQKNILRTIIDSLPHNIFYKDKSNKFIGYNKNFKNFYNKLGVTDIIGKSDLDIFPDKDTAMNFIKQDEEVISSKIAKYSEYYSIDENGNPCFEESVKVPVIDDSGNVWGVVGISNNITKRKILEDKLRYLSYTDSLTELYNRSYFEEKIKELNDEKYLPLGVIMGDVNGLKLVNDTFGHLEGDKLLKSIAYVLKNVCGDKGFVFRWGGDEFIMLIPNCNENLCENTVSRIRFECENCNYDFIKLSIALGETVKYFLDQDVYECIKDVEEKVYRQKLLDGKSVRSALMDSLRKTLEAKHTETEEHTERVVKYAYVIGKALNFKIAQLDELYLVAKLHDIGKIGIKEDILLKSDTLTTDELKIMRTHCEKGYRILQASGELENVATCVLCHHERWDGTGYPIGLSKSEIPLMARIIAVADSYDAMTCERPYKKALTKKEAIEELQKCSGSQFDPDIIKAFLNYLKNNDD
ncbi:MULTISPECIES: sensor domain-containing diguanylate cyclase/phosphohydrolase [Clostridium]|uniref:sensor domain-containing diguanylate cyclase/phosphohydrolase n=1 Tax=Clostridium TaxID=1485 RepID=UPI0003FDC8C0|nr:HD domain-containing phosphohydrolase [Clostridium cadaveris]MDU4953710.1 diguanylate cyclase [Clostridium sp.]NME65288.1 diguanylate cyclase [Clostridium cadaveris]